ncbi:Gfo/Idh/MocA family protein [Streptomyces sp. HB2AG]|uniref:Gfo/Idh/MocA family protein n=1 Tax=Streptomyces sp. HB2AG TaxID=2983400 RepID=UPI0022AA5D12|nr:Gfo/Idh/MocA family oxidoreductase [Streptomyces sp. HB2AG]MCZ2524529.1 Gfo/Idh/MocA family oxidoreductase [Streptomyces sp. HB2AG]
MRIGLLGTGPWAERVHAPSLSEHPGVELVGVWGRRAEAARELAERHGARAYDDPDALVADVDAVALALPPGVQAELAARAAGAGRHLLLEKPLADTVPAARRVAEAVRRTGAASVVFFTLRFGTPEQQAWISEQAAHGGWFTARAEWLAPVFGDRPAPGPESPWRRERGALWDVGPHALSVLLPVLGDVTDVTAARGPLDTVHLVTHHEGGASATLTLSLSAPPAAAGTAVELRGRAGTAALPVHGDGPQAAHGRAVDALLATARSGGPHPCGAGFGLRVVEALDAAERSLRDGGSVQRPPAPHS